MRIAPRTGDHARQQHVPPDGANRSPGRCASLLGLGSRSSSAATDDVGEFDGCDLVVAADGAASAIRRVIASTSSPCSTCRHCLVWDHRSLRPAVAHLSRERDGLLIAHAYRYSRTHSTFLVECDPQTWHSAGLTTCRKRESHREHVFGTISTVSHCCRTAQWFRYVVSNRRWYRGNLVLLGDALRPSLRRVGHAARDAGCDRAVRGVSRSPTCERGLPNSSAGGGRVPTRCNAAIKARSGTRRFARGLRSTRCRSPDYLRRTGCRP